MLGLDGPVPLDPREMARDLEVTWFPRDQPDVDPTTQAFADEIAAVLEDLGVTVLPYEQATDPLPKRKLAKWYAYAAWNTVAEPIREALGQEDPTPKPTLDVIAHLDTGPKIRPGVSIFAVGPGQAGALPVDRIMSFRRTSICTILDWPDRIDDDAGFQEHFDQAMELFGYHMTNIVLGVDEDRWILYNFNGAHPVFPRSRDLEAQVLDTLIPKLAAPIDPPRLPAFTIQTSAFDPSDDRHRAAVEDMVEAGSLLAETGLYPPGKSIEELPWRNELYRWAGAIHLDDRTGMSYGFLARQLPVDLPTPVPAEDAENANPILEEAAAEDREVAKVGDRLFALLALPDGPVWTRVPEVWVLTQRSGSDKTSMDGRRDLVKLGLVDGTMVMQTPRGVELREDDRPSFDTRVILAHGLGNALAATILAHREEDHPYARQMAEDGMAMAHFHGYLDRKHIPGGWQVHGAERPHVSCGTPQAALYALHGKLEALEDAMASGQKFLGDIHIEPQHGSVLTFPSLRELGAYLAQHPEAATLGNENLDQYT